MQAGKTLNPEDGYRHGLRGYVTGFILAAILTVIPFVLVAEGALPAMKMVWVIGVLGVIQLMVQVHYFLHVDLSRERREELSLMLFSGVVVFLMVGGMLWILLNLYTRMMMPM